MAPPLELDPIEATDLAWLRFERHCDKRGWLSGIFNEMAASDLDLPDFSQDNISYAGTRGVVRGLHFQLPPHAQHKLFRVIRGRVFNVAVDLRPASFGAVRSSESDADDGAWIYIPVGFAHGFQALEDRVDVHFKLTKGFSPSSLGGVRHDDPVQAIDWPLACPRGLLSARDRDASTLEDVRAAFQSPA